MMGPPDIVVPGVRHVALETSVLGQKIGINHLNFYYGEVRALREISLPLHADKVTAIIGPFRVRKIDTAEGAESNLLPISEPARRRTGNHPRMPGCHVAIWMPALRSR